MCHDGMQRICARAGTSRSSLAVFIEAVPLKDTRMVWSFQATRALESVLGSKMRRYSLRPKSCSAFSITSCCLLLSSPTFSPAGSSKFSFRLDASVCNHKDAQISHAGSTPMALLRGFFLGVGLLPEGPEGENLLQPAEDTHDSHVPFQQETIAVVSMN